MWEIVPKTSQNQLFFVGRAYSAKRVKLKAEEMYNVVEELQKRREASITDEKD